MINFFITPAYKVRCYSMKDLIENAAKVQVNVHKENLPIIFENKSNSSNLYIYYASETGIAERFIEDLSETF